MFTTTRPGVGEGVHTFQRFWGSNVLGLDLSSGKGTASTSIPGITLAQVLHDGFRFEAKLPCSQNAVHTPAITAQRLLWTSPADKAMYSPLNSPADLRKYPILPYLVSGAAVTLVSFLYPPRQRYGSSISLLQQPLAIRV